jgi:lambda family phage portal protein
MASFFTRIFGSNKSDNNPQPKPRRVRGAYIGAAQNRLNMDWNASLESPDQEAWRDLLALRGRSRDLAKNNAYAARYLDLLAINVIGPHGVALQARVRNAADEIDPVINSTIEKAWDRWGRSATIDGRLSWSAVQRLLIRTVAQDGEAFVRLISSADVGNDFNFALQLIDADLLDVVYTRTAGRNINAIVQGVEVDAFNRPVAYHFFSGYPGVGSGVNIKRIRVPASEIIPLYQMHRGNSTRGVPWLAASMSHMKLLGELMAAELVNQKTSASKMGFIKTGAENADAYAEDSVTLLGQGEFMEAQPGQITRLDPGDEFVAWNPDHPSTAFDAFTKMVLRGIAAGLNVSYSALSHDYSTENFSSARLAHQEQVAYYRTLQQWMIQQLHERVFAAWLAASLESGALPLSNKNPAAYSDIAWKPRGFDYYDPTKEVNAIQTKLALGLTSRTIEVAKEGKDVASIFADIDRENQLAKEYNIDIGGNAKNAAVPAPTPAPVAPATSENDPSLQPADDAVAQPENE